MYQITHDGRKVEEALSLATAKAFARARSAHGDRIEVRTTAGSHVDTFYMGKGGYPPVAGWMTDRPLEDELAAAAGALILALDRFARAADKLLLDSERNQLSVVRLVAAELPGADR